VVAGGLLSFFVAFNILEAMLPSLISRIAHAERQGRGAGGLQHDAGVRPVSSAVPWAAGW
jgi:hypothetical protein